MSSAEASSDFYIGPKVYYGRLAVDNTDSSLAGLLGLENFNTYPQGLMYGFNTGYTYKKPCGLYANVDVNYGQGSLKRANALSRYLHEYDASAVFGYYQENTCNRWSWAPYVGLGYTGQYYNLTSLHTTYRYSVVNIPIGVTALYTVGFPCTKWTMGLNVAVMPQIESYVKINLLPGAYWSLAKRSDWLVAIPIEYRWNSVCPRFVALNLFWKKVSYGGSQAVTSSGQTLGLPPEKWNAIGATLDFVWHF